MNCHGDLCFTVQGHKNDIRWFSFLIYYARDTFGRMGLSGRYLSEATDFSDTVQKQAEQILEQIESDFVLKFKTFHDSLSVPMVLLLLASEQFWRYCPGMSLQMEYQAIPGKSDEVFSGVFAYDNHERRWHMSGDMPQGGLFCPDFPTMSWETYRNLYESSLNAFALSF